MLLAAQHCRHRGALRATLAWRSCVQSSKASRIAADAAEARILRIRARSLVRYWRRTSRRRSLSRAFLKRNRTSTCALVWRVWWDRTSHWKANSHANRIAASAHTSRVLRTVFSSWHDSAVEQRQSRSALRHYQLATLRHSFGAWRFHMHRVSMSATQNMWKSSHQIFIFRYIRAVG